MLQQADTIRYRSIGHPEDWSCEYMNTRTGRRVYIIDTGGRYELCRDLQVYERTGNTFATYETYRHAVDRAIVECK